MLLLKDLYFFVVVSDGLLSFDQFLPLRLELSLELLNQIVLLLELGPRCLILSFTRLLLGLPLLFLRLVEYLLSSPLLFLGLLGFFGLSCRNLGSIGHVL